MSANYLIDQTPLRQIQYDLQKAAMYGDGAVLGLLKVDNTSGGYTSLVPGGVKVGWRARKINGAPTKRLIDVLLIEGMTVDICRAASAFQINGVLLVKVDQTPWDGSTPAVWTFEAQYNTTDTPITL